MGSGFLILILTSDIVLHGNLYFINWICVAYLFIYFFYKNNSILSFLWQTDAKVFILQVGNGVLSLNFTGELNDKMKGFYRSKYKGSDGSDRYGAVTQFEVGSMQSYFLLSVNVSKNCLFTG